MRSVPSNSTNERSGVRSLIADWGAKTDVHVFPVPGLETRAGAGVTRHRFRQSFENRFTLGEAAPRRLACRNAIRHGMDTSTQKRNSDWANGHILALDCMFPPML